MESKDILHNLSKFHLPQLGGIISSIRNSYSEQFALLKQSSTHKKYFNKPILKLKQAEFIYEALTLYSILFKFQKYIAQLPREEDYLLLLQQQVQLNYISIFIKVERYRQYIYQLLTLIAELAFRKGNKLFHSTLMGKRYQLELIQILHQMIYGLEMSDKFSKKCAEKLQKIHQFIPKKYRSNSMIYLTQIKQQQITFFDRPVFRPKISTRDQYQLQQSIKQILHRPNYKRRATIKDTQKFEDIPIPVLPPKQKFSVFNMNQISTSLAKKLGYQQLSFKRSQSIKLKSQYNKSILIPPSQQETEDLNSINSIMVAPSRKSRIKVRMNKNLEYYKNILSKLRLSSMADIQKLKEFNEEEIRQREKSFTPPPISQPTKQTNPTTKIQCKTNLITKIFQPSSKRNPFINSSSVPS